MVDDQRGSVPESSHPTLSCPSHPASEGDVYRGFRALSCPSHPASGGDVYRGFRALSCPSHPASGGD
eukprot:9642359-Heterocapsa_arctica.AAC.1